MFFSDYFSLDCHVSIWRTLKILFYSFQFVSALSDTPLFVYCVSISCFFRIFLHSIDTRVCLVTTINGPFLEIWGIVYHSKDSSRFKTVVGKRLLTELNFWRLTVKTLLTPFQPPKFKNLLQCSLLTVWNLWFYPDYAHVNFCGLNIQGFKY